MDSNTNRLDWEPEAYLFDFEGTLVTFEWNLSIGVKTVLNQIESIGYSMNLFDSSPSYVDIYKVASVISERDDESIHLKLIQIQYYLLVIPMMTLGQPKQRILKVVIFLVGKMKSMMMVSSQIL